MKTAQLRIQCFGLFREIGDYLMVEIELGATILDIKSALTQTLDDPYKSRVEHAVLADDEMILPNAYVVNSPVALSILPPVSGG